MVQPLSKEAAGKVADARSILVNEYPFWMVEIYAIPWYACNELPEYAALGVSNTGIGLIREADAISWDPHRFATEILHEFIHVFSHSFLRSALLGMPELKYIHNLAQDLPINSWIKKELATKKGLRELPNWVLPETFGFPDNLSYEEYFALFVNNLKNLEKTLIKLGVLGADGTSEGENKPTTGSGHCNCNSDLANELARQALASEAIPKGERDDLASRPSTKMAELAGEMAAKAAASGAFPQQAGKGSLRNLLGVERQEPTLPWNVYLRRWMSKAYVYARGFKEYDWTRPARRSPFQMVMPKMRSRIPAIAAAIDSSGSMYGSGIAEASAEVGAIARELGFALSVIFCDDAITNIVDVKGWEDVAKGMKGGGGTGFTEVFEYIAGMPPNKRPKTLIFVTDGYVSPSDVPKTCPPGLKVLWVVTRGGARVPVSWGDQVQVGTNIKL